MMHAGDAMMLGMRTTINIDDALLTEVKLISAKSRRPVGEVIDDALRLMLSQQTSPRRAHVPLPTYGRGGLHPGVDLDDKEALADLLGDNRLSSADR